MDLAEGHLLAMEFLLNEKPQINYLNLGTGSGTSVLDLIKIFQEVNDVLIPYKFVGRREGDLPIVVADNSKGTVQIYFDYSNGLAFDDDCDAVKFNSGDFDMSVITE